MTIAVPRVLSLAEARENPGAMASLSLGQTWEAQPCYAPATVRLVALPDALYVRADLVDEDVCTQAGADNQRLWELGDAFEVFLEQEGGSFYFEGHVSPAGHRLQLRLTGGDHMAIRAGKANVEDFLQTPGFQADAAKTVDGWAVEAIVPAVVVQGDDNALLLPGRRWKASFCRYDAWSDGRKPVISSTSPHRVASFHLRDDWRILCF